MMRLKVFIFILIVISSAPAVLAEGACPTIVQSALAAVDSACSSTARNQVCYGNIRLQATPQASVTNFKFDQAGDIANVADIQELQLSSFNAADDTWGVALMKLQANLPDTLPGQNVTFLLFGDVQIQNAVTAAPEISMTATANANVRSLPTTSGSTVIASLKNGQAVTANGRLADNSWVRIKLDSDPGVGWVSAQFIKGDLTSLSVIQVGAPQPGPMQAFYFKTGQDDHPCDQAPDSGLLVQSPQGAGRVAFNADGVDVTLGSTAYLQTAGGFMIVSVVEGAATLTAAGQTQIVPAGTFARVPLDANGRASGAPEAPQPYDAARLQTLPLKLAVWEKVDIAPSLPADQIAAAIQALQRPRSGTWSMAFAAAHSGSCDAQGATLSVKLTFALDGSLSMFIPATGVTIAFDHPSGSIYTATNTLQGVTDVFNFNFLSPTTMSGEDEATFPQCTFKRAVTASWVSS